MESLPSKTCTKCGEIKTIDEYSKHKTCRGGRRSSCKDCNNLRDRKYYVKNREAVLERNKEWRENNSEYRKKYYEENRESFFEYAKKWRKENPELHRASKKKWRKENPEKRREHLRRRLARKKGNGVQKYTEAQVLETYGSACHICEREIDLTAPRRVGASGWEDGLHIDHLIPISKGGPDMLENVKPSHASCNLKKSDKL